MQRKFGERLLSSPQLLDEPPPAYPAMASDASDSARTHARTLSLTFLTFLTDATPLLSAPLFPPCSHPRLGFTYLGHSSSTMSLCRYFRQRACLGDEAQACTLASDKNGRESSFAPKSSALQTRRAAVNEPLSRSIFEERDRGQSVNGRSQS